MADVKPQVGEVWSVSNGGTAEYLVIGTSPNVTFLSRTQVCLSISHQSLGLLGKYERDSLKEACSSCGEKAIASGLDRKPYCLGHLPQHQPIYFPGDPLDKVTPLWGDLTCPTCKVPLTNKHTIERSLMVVSCDCCSTFIPLITQKLFKTGTNRLDSGLLSEGLSLALESLRERDCSRFFMHLSPSLPMVNFSVASNTLSAHIQDLGLSSDSLRGVVVNSPSVVQYVLLEGRPDLTPEEEDVLHQKLYPGSLWKSRKGNEFLRVVRIAHSLDAILCLGFNGLNNLSVYTEFKEVRLRAEYRRVSPKEAPFRTLTGQRFNPNPLKVRPAAGDLWYNHEQKAYSKVIQVTENVVTFYLASHQHIHSSPIEYLATVDEFQQEHDASNEHLFWKVGSTYLYGDNQCGELKSFDTFQVLLTNGDATTCIPIKEFWGAKVVLPRPILDRILEDECF